VRGGERDNVRVAGKGRVREREGTIQEKANKTRQDKTRLDETWERKSEVTSNAVLRQGDRAEPLAEIKTAKAKAIAQAQAQEVVRH
jgi:hypothetical protein